MSEDTSPSLYDQVKGQIKYQTGKQALTCPVCQKNAAAHVSGMKTGRPRNYRNVRTACRHCKTIITFCWYN